MGKETKNTVSLIVIIAVALMGAIILWGIYGTIRKEVQENYNAVNTSVYEAKSALDTSIADLDEETSNGIKNVKNKVNAFEAEANKEFKALNDKLLSYPDVEEIVAAAKEEVVEDIAESEGNVETAIDAAKDDVVDAVNTAKRKVKKAVNAAEDSLNTAITTAEDNVNEAISTAKTDLSTLISNESKAIKDLIGKDTDKSTAMTKTKTLFGKINDLTGDVADIADLIGNKTDKSIDLFGLVDFPADSIFGRLNDYTTYLGTPSDKSIEIIGKLGNTRTVFGKLNDLTIKVADLDSKIDAIKTSLDSKITQADLVEALRGIQVSSSKISDAVKELDEEQIAELKTAIAKALKDEDVVGDYLFNPKSGHKKAIANIVVDTLLGLAY